jgi:hypothetical protein
LAVVLTIALRVLSHDSCEATIGSIRVLGWIASIVSSPLGILSVVVGSLSVRICSANRSCRDVSNAVLCTVTAATIAAATSIPVALASITITTVATIASVTAVAITSSAASVAISVAAVSVWWWAILKCLVVCLYLLE